MKHANINFSVASTLLTICIVNIDGGMGWGDFGYFADTCYGCTVLNADSNNPLLSCKCKTKIGNYAIALLDLVKLLAPELILE
jgi:hypothetical protein